MTTHSYSTSPTTDYNPFRPVPERLNKMLSDHADVLCQITVANKKIGVDHPAFIIAEAACNHMCDMDLAKQMIDKAGESDADAIKFQTYTAEKLVTKDAVAFWGNEEVSQLEYYHRLDRFGPKEYELLFKYAVDRGLIPFSSPFDSNNARMLNEIGMSLFKIASCDIPNILHIRQIAEFGKPIILSTGASTPEEIDRAIMTILEVGNAQLMLLACTLSYPTRNEDANLRRITTLRNRYPELIIGLSDHTAPDEHMVIDSFAVALGAKIIEKHYTLDRTMTGSGHFFAVDPEALTKMITNIRLAETVLGDGKLGVAISERKAWASARRSIVADVPIRKGTVISPEMIGLKRPADGLSADMIDRVVGKRAKVDIRLDQKIDLEMIET